MALELDPACAPACTVMLLRDGSDGIEVFLVQRNARSGFMPHMWVFPGGRVDAADTTLPEALAHGGDALRRGWTPADARALAVAGAREVFEESGLWLGDGAPPVDLREALAAGRVGLEACLTAGGGRLDLDRIAPWARWVTPPGEGRRFDTAFLVALVDGVGRHDDGETVASGWFRPREVLAGGFARFPLAPPTWVTLRQLTAFDHAEEVRVASRHRDLTPLQPVPRVAEEGLVMHLPGDPLHGAPARPGVPARLRLRPEGWEAEEP